MKLLRWRVSREWVKCMGRDGALPAFAAVNSQQPQTQRTRWLQLSKRFRLKPREAETEKGSGESEQKPKERPNVETQHLHHTVLISFSSTKRLHWQPKQDLKASDTKIIDLQGEKLTVQGSGKMEILIDHYKGLARSWLLRSPWHWLTDMGFKF